MLVAYIDSNEEITGVVIGISISFERIRSMREMVFGTLDSWICVVHSAIEFINCLYLCRVIPKQCFAASQRNDPAKVQTKCDMHKKRARPNTSSSLFSVFPPLEEELWTPR